jgi:hypothetical protein
MNKIKKIRMSLGIKGFLCLLAFVSIATALVSYTSEISANPIQQFTVGSASYKWDVYVNEVNQVKYLPGDTTLPTLNTADSSTYAYKVVTDSNKVCALKIQLTSVIDKTKFSNFNITVLCWDDTNGKWGSEKIYAAATGSTVKSSIDGTSGDLGYIHQATSTKAYYLLQVTYSYDKVDTTTTIDTAVQYTPLPQTAF